MNATTAPILPGLVTFAPGEVLILRRAWADPQGTELVTFVGYWHAGGRAVVADESGAHRVVLTMLLSR